MQSLCFLKVHAADREEPGATGPGWSQGPKRISGSGFRVQGLGPNTLKPQRGHRLTAMPRRRGLNGVSFRERRNLKEPFEELD